MAAIRKLFTRKPKEAPLVCTMHLSDPTHVHTDACFASIAPLQIVELFQSQGCVSCPPAIPIIHDNLTDPNVLLLTYDVTYWDHQGWKDTFGSTQWDQRQRSYVTKWGRDGIFTPHLVVDGSADGVGSRNGEVADLLGKARAARDQQDYTVNIDITGNSARITSEKPEAETHDIIVVSYEPTLQNVKIGKGPNKGKKLNHRNIVRGLTKIGEWKGGEVTATIPAGREGLEQVLFVQAGAGGPILAASKL